MCICLCVCVCACTFTCEWETDRLTDWLHSMLGEWRKEFHILLTLSLVNMIGHLQAVAIWYVHTHIPVNLSKVCPSEFCLHTHCTRQTFCHWLCIMKHMKPSCSPFIWTCEYVYNATLDVIYTYCIKCNCVHCLQDVQCVTLHGTLMRSICHCKRMLADAITAKCMSE